MTVLPVTIIGWRNHATAQMAEQIDADAVLLLETLDRINGIASGLSIDELIEHAGREAAAASYFRIEHGPAHRDDIAWTEIGEHLLQRLLSHGLDPER